MFAAACALPLSQQELRTRCLSSLCAALEVPCDPLMWVQVGRVMGSRNVGLLPLRVSLSDEMWMCHCVFNGQLLEWLLSPVLKDVFE